MVPRATAGVSSIQQSDHCRQTMAPAGETIRVSLAAAMTTLPFSASTGEPSPPPPMRQCQTSLPLALSRYRLPSVELK